MQHILSLANINVVIIVGVILAITLITRLRIKGKIESSHYVILFSFTILAAMGFYLSDRLVEVKLGLNGGQLTLARAEEIKQDIYAKAESVEKMGKELKEIKNDIYAKAESVKKMGEELADLAASDAITMGLFGESFSDEYLLKTRDKLAITLRGIGCDKTKTDQISSKINNRVLGSLKVDVFNQITEIPHSQADRDEVQKTVNNLLFSNYNRTKLINYLKEHKVYRSELEPSLDKVDKFIKNKTLK